MECSIPMTATPTATEPTKQPDPFTLILGGERLLVDRAVSRVVAAARQADPDTELRVIDASQPGAAGAVTQACSPTLFGSGSAVVVENVESAPPDVVAAIVAGARDIGGAGALVAVHAGGAKGKRQLEALLGAKPVRVACPEIKRGRALAEFVQLEFRSRHRTVASDAATMLAAVCGTDVRLVAAACAQLCDDVPKRTITSDDVRLYFGSTAEVTGFQIADALLARRPAEALRLVRTAEVTDSGSVGPAAVAAIVSSLRQVVKYSAAGPGMSERDLAVAIGVPAWRLRSIADQARRWRPAEIAAAVLMLADADAALKGGLREGDQLDPAQKSLALEQLISRMPVRQ